MSEWISERPDQSIASSLERDWYTECKTFSAMDQSVGKETEEIEDFFSF